METKIMEQANDIKTEKPVKAKAQFYAVCFEGLKIIAKECGYNLIIHGSMARDFDLVAIPWVDNPKKHLELMDAFSVYLGLPISRDTDGNGYYMGKHLQGGRSTYVINLNRGGRFNGYIDEQWYIDISVTPLPDKAANQLLLYGMKIT